MASKKPKAFGHGFNKFIVLTKPSGGRVALWPEGVIGIEEFQAASKPNAAGFRAVPITRPPSAKMDVFVHHTDYSEPIPVAQTFEEVHEQVKQAWEEEHS